MLASLLLLLSQPAEGTTEAPVTVVLRRRSALWLWNEQFVTRRAVWVNGSEVARLWGTECAVVQVPAGTVTVSERYGAREITFVAPPGSIQVLEGRNLLSLFVTLVRWRVAGEEEAARIQKLCQRS